MATARNTKVDIALIAAAFVWGASYLAAKQLTEAGSLWGMLALRFTAAAAILLLIRAFKPTSGLARPWEHCSAW
jgi:drug/metabolite transporter (DMT)-like permease